jgi:hypothetical protein
VKSTHNTHHNPHHIAPSPTPPTNQINRSRDGDVYRALLDMAQGSPLNATQEGPAWHGLLKPAMAAAGAAPRAKL